MCAVAVIQAEAVPGQWSYTLGPCAGIELGDQLWMSRYVLHRLAENFGVIASLDPKPVSHCPDLNTPRLSCLRFTSLFFSNFYVHSISSQYFLPSSHVSQPTSILLTLIVCEIRLSPVPGLVQLLLFLRLASLHRLCRSPGSGAAAGRR